MEANQIIKVYGKEYAVVQFFPTASWKECTSKRIALESNCQGRATVRLPKGHKIIGWVEVYADQNVALFE